MNGGGKVETGSMAPNTYAAVGTSFKANAVNRPEGLTISARLVEALTVEM